MTDPMMNPRRGSHHALAAAMASAPELYGLAAYSYAPRDGSDHQCLSPPPPVGRMSKDRVSLPQASLRPAPLTLQDLQSQ